MIAPVDQEIKGENHSELITVVKHHVIRNATAKNPFS